jgi:alkaline phosphatase
MFSGEKTANGRIGVSSDGVDRLENLGDRSRQLAMAVGAVTTVPVSHATPGAFTAHNLSRANSYAIGDEALFGDPNTTGNPDNDPKYEGGIGFTYPVTTVLVGTRDSGYVHPLQRDKLLVESGDPGKHILVEGQEGVDAGAALLAVSADPQVSLLAGLFDRANLKVTSPGGGHRLETPTLAESAMAAMAILARAEKGFSLMVEGGAVDWAGHANDLAWVIGELHDFNDAVAAVTAWVNDPSNGSTWSNTLVVVTGDHETGYLTAAPGGFSSQPLAAGSVGEITLALEKVNLDTGRRASWIDNKPPNDRIDDGERVFWAWNTSGHSNSLIPVFARGVGSQQLANLADQVDPVRGPYVDNIDLHTLMVSVLDLTAEIFSDGFETGGIGEWGNSR